MADFLALGLLGALLLGTLGVVFKLLEWTLRLLLALVLLPLQLLGGVLALAGSVLALPFLVGFLLLGILAVVVGALLLPLLPLALVIGVIAAIVGLCRRRGTPRPRSA